MFDGCITDVAGIRAGHYTDSEAMTGCTFIMCEGGAVSGVDVRGGAPGTRETDAFSVNGSVPLMNGVMLSGGSAFGLASADGAMAYLEENGQGFDTGVAKVPLVGAAVIFDLAYGRADVRPDRDAGYAAAKAAYGVASEKLEQGSVGAGTGATVAKLLGMDKAIKSGIGAASMNVAGATLAAIACVNAVGNIYDYRNGSLIAGHNVDLTGYTATPGENTTIGLIATDAKLDKLQAKRLAMLAHDGMAMSIRPVHTTSDGDTAFAMATGRVDSNVDILFAYAAEVFARAIQNAVTGSTT